MRLQEYQGKELFRRVGIPVADGGVAFSAADAEEIARRLGSPVVVKAQVLVGGRGKAGGIKLAQTPQEARAHAETILNMTIKGERVRKVLVTKAVEIEREFYLSVTIDRVAKKPIVIFSAEGGMEIEEVAASHPEKILKVAIDPATGMQPHHARSIAFGLGLEGKQIASATKFMLAMYEAFTALDASIVEINPLVVTGAGEMIALDAKMNFDDNALYRHKDVEDMRDPDEEDASELEAAKWSLNYVKLDGEIGCMVNGAGLAMATMDIIKLYGSEPANFLDVGGGATKERVTAAFKIILGDKNVKGILVNIFGGIMRCDIIAEGVVAAAREVKLAVPLVVRLEGTNVDLGKKIMAESGLPIISADNLADAAEKVVKAVKGAK
ncbi:MAG: ADP-forming succinate--CoA ligase subunit beta [Ferrovibrio sp.]